QLDTEASIQHPGLAGRTVAQADFTNEGLLTPDTDFFGYNAGTVANPQHLVWINDFHATAVAGVMVGNGLDSANVQTNGVGVAPKAQINFAKMWTSQLNKNDPTWGTQALMAFARVTDITTERHVAILEDQSAAGNANGSGLFALAADYAAW